MVKGLSLLLLFIISSCNPLSEGQIGSVKGANYVPGLERGKFPDHLEIVQGQGQSALYGTILPIPLQVKLTDKQGAPVFDYNLRVSVLTGGGLISSSTLTTDANGIASLVWTLGNVGANSLKITGTGSFTGSPKFVTFTATATSTPFTTNWPFDIGTSADYTFTSSLIEFNAGNARLIGTDQVDDDDDASGFSGGVSTGVLWDGASNFMRLGSAGSCDGSATNCSDLNASWTPKWSNIKGYWPLNGSGALIHGAAVAATIGSNATAFNALSYTTGQVRQGILMNGSNNAVIIPDSADLRLTGNFTLHMWVKPNLLKDYGNLLWKANYPGDGYGLASGADGNWQWQVSPAASNPNAGAGSLVVGQWSQLNVTWDGTTLNLYQDGILKRSATSLSVPAALPIISGTHDLYVGTDNDNGRYFDGIIDDFAVWNTTLTQTELQTIYSRQSPKYSGTHISRVMDSLTAGASWTALAWSTTLPFFKELPDAACSTCAHVNNETSTDYSSLVGSTGATSDNNLMSGISGLWHLDESSWNGTANEVKDDSGNENHGTRLLAGARITTDGKFFNAGEFDKSADNDVVTIANSPSLQMAANQSFTVSAWFKAAPAQWNQVGFIVTKGASNSGSPGYGIFMHSNNIINGRLSDGTVNLYGPSSTTTYNQNQWNHVVYTVNRTTEMSHIFLNGVKSAGLSTATVGALGAVSLNIGGIPANVSDFAGKVDEVAIWKRTLHDSEVQQLYRRGVNRVRYLIRTCSTANAGLTDCTDGSVWKGPNGTSGTYFSELNNNTVALNGSGHVKKDDPSLLIAAFTTPPGANRYFQYYMVLESDDTATGCNYGAGATRCSPELKSVTIDPVHYESSAPTIIGKNGVNYLALNSFVSSLGTGGCSSGVLYNLGVGATAAIATWYWWNNTNWVVADGTVSEANTAAAINTNSASFGNQIGTGKVYFKAFLQSSGSSSCALDNVQISGDQ